MKHSSRLTYDTRTDNSATVHWLDDAVHELEERHLLRTPVRITAHGPTHAAIDGREVVVFCGNDYLGLRCHPELIAAARRGLDAGVGAGASRLVSGNTDTHERTERVLAKSVGLEAALLTSSGFATNVGVLPALVGDGDVVFSDALNHASLIDGIRLSRARTAVFPHADALTLAHLVQRHRPFRRGWIVSESLFSMDGDVAPLPAYARLAEREGLQLYVDEAHAVGVLGGGAGECAANGIKPDVLVGTLGKAYGGAGAFVAGSQTLRTYLWNRCRSHVFSTGLPPAMAEAALAAVGLAAGPSRRERLQQNIARLRNRLSELGQPPTSRDDSPIVPIVVGDERRATRLSTTLLEHGFFVQAIRPPTVPAGTSRLRVTLSAEHTPSEIDAFANALVAGLR